MRKRTIVILLALLLLLPLVLTIWGLGLPPKYDGTFMGELKYKVRLMEDTPGPRIILVGGSGVAFGVDSAALEEELPGYRVVNFGMYAALGTTVMLDLSEKRVRPGDLVILIPEQQAQTLSDYFDPAVMWQGLDGAFGLLRDLPGEKLGRLLGAYPAFAGQKFAWTVQGRTPEPQGVYARSSFNGYGDVDSPLCTGNVMPGGWDESTPIRFDGELLDPAFAERVRDYAAALEKRGATVYYALGPMNAAAVTGEAEPGDFYDALSEQLALPILGDPADSVLAPEWFYDTNFHLNSSGKLLYTRVLTEGIKAMLGDSSPTEIPIPPMPELETEALWQGDDGDWACFLYESRDGALTVTGLTEAGLGRERLTVPSTRDGLPVKAIAAGAFSEGKDLKEIVIQRSIRTIGEGAFDGCESLRKIVLDQQTPAACRVGPDLLSGSEARILVPPGTLTDYRTDYFWSLHAQRIGEQTEE